MTSIYKGKIYADYYTFYLQDKESKQDYEALATNEGFEKMLSVGDQMLHINTKRYADVPVSVTLFKKAPKLNLDTIERANECSLHISTVALLGNFISGTQELPLDAGIYRVRILYKNLSSVQNDWIGKDKYTLQLWQEQAMRETVYLK